MSQVVNNKQDMNNMTHARFKLDFSEQKQRHFLLDVDLTIPTKGITAIFGQSGSGKTTLLRCIAGLHKAQQGRLIVNNETWQQGALFLPTYKRSVAYVFQEPSLFPHLTAQGNLSYAMKRAREGRKDQNEQLFEQVVTLLGIEPLLQKKPQQLSGGERQRVAIARAILAEPKLLLMDEPLASLDEQRKQEILPYLESLRDNFNIPIIYVSHSIDEVTRLADHVIFLEQGKAVRQGNVQKVFSCLDLPISLGNDTGVVLQGRIINIQDEWQLATIKVDDQELTIANNGFEIGQLIRLRIFAKDISIASKPQRHSSILNSLPATVEEIVDDEYHPAMMLIKLSIGKHQLISRLTRKSVYTLNLKLDDQIWAQIKSVAVVQ